MDGRIPVKKKKKIWKIVLIVLLVLIAALAVMTFAGLKFYTAKDEEKKAAAPGNAAEYSLENVQPLENSPLQGKKILFLGSSVTYGAASRACSFADYIGKLDGVEVTKEAVSATTLVDAFSPFAFLLAGDGRSYVARLKEVDPSIPFDAVVVQLSTNDATMKKPLGEVSASFDRKDFDAKTVTGAMEYIIAYCRETWNCPVIFYTGSYYESAEYAAMVARLQELADKWEIPVADLYTDEAFNDIEEDKYSFYMFDRIHPTKAGYLEWWTPAIEAVLYDALQ